MKLSKESLQKMIQEELGFLREQDDWDYAMLADAVIDWISDSLVEGEARKLNRVMKNWFDPKFLADPIARNIAGPRMEINIETPDGPKVIILTATVEGHDR